MAPVADQGGMSAKRAQFTGPAGIKGIFYNAKTSAIACFAALGGFVYGCKCDGSTDCRGFWQADPESQDNQGMFGQILTMHSFIEEVRIERRCH